MLYTEEEAPLLKKWIIKRLEKSSDADADVLADYVLALLKHDGDINSVRQLCEAEVPDFLNEDSSIFVQDVFDAIQYKSFLPGAPPPPSRRPSLPFAPPTGPSAPSYGNLGVGAPLGPMNGSRKRSYNDRGDGDAQDRGFHGGGDPNNRMYKQPRRGGPGGGRGNFDNFGNNRGGYGGNRPPQMNPQNMPPQGFPNMPGMPSPPPGMPPFDPSNPMGAILAMQQALGLPIPPQFPQNSSPGARQQGSQPARRKARCRDYDEKGFCTRGQNCMFEHGDQSIFVPPSKQDEYDPSNANIMTGIEGNNGNGSYSHIPNVQLGRGRGRGRGDRGGGMSTRKNGRAEFSSDRPNHNKDNTSIVVENIPEDKFTEEEVRAFFSEFGNIAEVSMRPYKRLAIVKFDVWDSAQAAYKSPKVIFDNRFVKVYWYIDQDSLPKAPAGNAGNKQEPGAPVPARTTLEPQIDIEEFTRKQQEVQKAHEEKMKKKQEMDVARKELEKRQEDLLKSQAEEKRKLLERISAKSGKDGSSNGSTTETPASDTKTPTQTDALKAQLAALEAEAQSLGIDTSMTDDASYGGRGGHRGRGGYRGRGDRGRGTFAPRGFRGGYRGRGGAPFAGAAGGSVYKLDNRPKTISLKGIDFTDPDKDESLRQYLLGIGEYTNLNTTPALTTVTFKERYIAEKFMYETPGSDIPSVGKVDMAWVSTPLPPVNLATLKIAPIAGNGEDVQMAEEGDAMAVPQGSSPQHGGMDREAVQNLDYDVADDEWS